MAVTPAASPGVQSAAVIALAAGLTAVLQPTGTVVTMHPGKDTLPWQAFYAAAYVVRGLIIIKMSTCVSTSLAAACFADEQNRDACVKLCVHMLQQAALEAACGATPVTQLLAPHGGLLPAWQAAASTLHRCSAVMLTTAAPRCRTINQSNGSRLSSLTRALHLLAKRCPCLAMQWFNNQQLMPRMAKGLAANVAAVDDRQPTPCFARTVIFDDVSDAIAKARL
jgi:hypothetical protein